LKIIFIILSPGIIEERKYFIPYRSLAIYLIGHFTPLPLSEIVELFKMDYSAVSQITKRFE